MLQNFLVNQPIWHLQEDKADRRWEFGVVENDPTEEEDRSMMPRQGIDEAMMEALSPRKEDACPTWVRLQRSHWIQGILSDDQQQSNLPWHRVAFVSGAGMGKTANLQWLCAQVNANDQGRGRMLAIFTHLRDLPSDLEQLPGFVYDWLKRHLDDHDKLRLEEVSLRLLKQGRILFLLDSLDEAGAAESGPAVIKLQSLLQNRWKQNPIWVSGRPYAFRAARTVLRQSDPDADWTFLRVGPLDEPEARQLVETASFRPQQRT